MFTRAYQVPLHFSDYEGKFYMDIFEFYVINRDQRTLTLDRDGLLTW